MADLGELAVRHLQCWHPVSEGQFESHWLRFQSSSCMWEGSTRWLKGLGPAGHTEHPSAMPGSWLQPNPAWGSVVIRGVNPKLQQIAKTLSEKKLGGGGAAASQSLLKLAVHMCLRWEQWDQLRSIPQNLQQSSKRESWGSEAAFPTHSFPPRLLTPSWM